MAHSHLRPFGCKLFYRDHEEISELSPRYFEGLMTGYITGTTSYRIWNQKRRKIIKTRFVIFPKVKNSNEVLELVDLKLSLERN